MEVRNPHCTWITESQKGRGDPTGLHGLEPKRQGHIGWKDSEARAVERPPAFMRADEKEYSDPEQLVEDALEFLSQPKVEVAGKVTRKE